MAETDFKVTVIGAINEVRKKAKLPTVTTLDQDSDSLIKLNYLNDVISEISDYGDWQEMLAETIVSVQTSVRDYAVSGVVIQNIHEVAASYRTSELRNVKLDQIRRLQRQNLVGAPNQWAVKGINGEGNPVISFDRWPTVNDASEHFDILYYEKPAVYTTADASATVPFPGRLVVQGLLAKTILDESDGEPTTRYASNLEAYNNMLKESYNRYNGDTGSTVYFRPGRGRR
jgi:hypothetical protein